MNMDELNRKTIDTSKLGVCIEVDVHHEVRRGLEMNNK